MEQISFPFSRNLPLQQLVADALGEIERLGYSGKSRRRYRATWEQLIEFAGRKGLGDAFAGEVAAQFLDEYRVAGQELGPGEGWRRHMRWGVKVLADFAQRGHIDRGRTEVEAIELVPAMQRTLREYQQFCTDRLHVRPTTLAKRTSELTMFLDFLHAKKRRALEEIQPLDLSEFLSCRDHLVPKSVSRLAVPLMHSTVQFLRDHIRDNRLDRPEQFDTPLFQSARHQRLSRSGIRYILQKYLVSARSKCPSLNRTVSPHTLRHTKGMHLLQSGISLDMIRDFLGHVDVKTTQLYARANLEMKRNALEKITGPSPIPTIPTWQQDKNLLDWLRSL